MANVLCTRKKWGGFWLTPAPLVDELQKLSLLEVARELKRKHECRYAFLVPERREGEDIYPEGDLYGNFYYHRELKQVPPGWVLVLTNQRLARNCYTVPEEHFDRLDEPRMRAKLLSGAL